MTQQVDPWDIPAPTRAAPQPLIPRTPPPQTADQAAIAHENAIAAHDRNQHIDPNTLRMMAQRYVTDGVQPNFGMGNAVDRRNFWEAVAHEVGANGGTGPDLAVRIRQFHNGTHALQVLENQLGTISGNEQSARGYAEQALSAVRALDPNNSWAPTNWLRNIVGDTTNDPNLGTWDTARNTFLTEYGKVVAGSPSGAGVLSDSARQEQMAVLRRTTNPQQAAAIIEQMQRDMDIRLHALQTNIQRGYENLRSGQPISFNPQGEALDERGNIVPVAGASRSDGPPGPVPRFMDHPPSGPQGGAPPGPTPGAPSGGGDMLDRTTVNMGARGADDVSLNTSGEQEVPDPALAGVNQHVAAMMNDRSIPDRDILQYMHDRGVPLNLVPGATAALAFRHQHTDARWTPNDISLDKHLVPQSFARDLATDFADTTPGAAALAVGNMVAGQQIPALVGATGGDAELARAGMAEIRNRHPIASVAGDVAGGAMLYAGGTRLVEGGMNAAERIAPTLYSRLPAWVTGAERAGAAGEAIAPPFSAEAASARTLAPTGTFAPRAIAGDAAIGAYESPGDRLGGAEVGAVTGLGARGTINTAGRAVSPTGGDLAPAYEEGVQPTLGQRMGGVTNRVEQAFQSIPIVGGIQRSARNAALDQWQLGGFNRALRNLPDEVQLPAKMEPGTAPHAFAQDAFDTAYDRVHKRINVVDDEQLQQDLTDIRQNATHLSDQSLSHFNRIIDNSVQRRLTNGEGRLTGDELQKTLGEIRRTARSIRSSPTGDGELAGQLDDLAGVIHDNAARHSAPEAISTLGGINRGYGMLVRIENASNRAGAGEPGEYTAKGLLNAERQQGGLRGRQFLAGNGLMTDYANAGLQLGQTVADSGTAERLATLTGGTGLAGGMGVVAHSGGSLGVIPAAAWAVDTAANIPGFRHALNWALKPNRASIRPFTDELRAQIQARAGIGSSLGLPAVVAAYSGSK